MRRLAFVAVLALSACAGGEPSPPPTYTEVAPPPPPHSPAEPVAEAPHDACGAYELRYLVGRPKSEIPIPVNPGSRRVTCTTCPVTMDYREDRLNIFFDAETGVIKEVKCG